MSQKMPACACQPPIRRKPMSKPPPRLQEATAHEHLPFLWIRFPLSVNASHYHLADRRISQMPCRVGCSPPRVLCCSPRSFCILRGRNTLPGGLPAIPLATTCHKEIFEDFGDCCDVFHHSILVCPCQTPPSNPLWFLMKGCLVCTVGWKTRESSPQSGVGNTNNFLRTMMRSGWTNSVSRGTPGAREDGPKNEEVAGKENETWLAKTHATRGDG